jgi:ArsR family transcriptional regulator, lead/cadmium/zinc/bismuth-responsive transcriptional repressor
VPAVPALRRRDAARPHGARVTSGDQAERVRRALDDHAQVARLSRTFRALGDPTRSRLVYALSLGELCVSDLAHALSASLSATSHQLRILRDLDIVRVRRQGRSQLYVLNERAFGFCAPSVCQAWRQTLEIESLGHARARRPRRTGR